MEVLREITRGDEDLQLLYEDIEKCVDTRRWYELGIQLGRLLESDGIAGNRQVVYDAVVRRYKTYIEVVQFAKIIELSSRDLPPEEAICFLEKESEDSKIVKETTTARQWIELHVVLHVIDLGDLERAMSQMYKLSGEIGQGTDLGVRILFYRVYTVLDKQQNDYDAFCEHGLLLLSTSGNSEHGNIVLAQDLCRSALCAKSVFSFDELASHPIMDSLRGTPDEWLVGLLRGMAEGKTDGIQIFEQQFVEILCADEIFRAHIDQIKLKVRLSVLQELIFQSALGSRDFYFDEIAEKCRVDVNCVELLVLKALASGLIRGFIDEVEQRVVITWCKTKTLSDDRLQHLKNEIDKWIKIVHDEHIGLQESAQKVNG